MESWKQINSQSDIDDLMRQVADFHDACIVSAYYKSGAFVEKGGSMHMSRQPESHELVVVFNSQLLEHAIELCFTGIRRMALTGWQENYGADILSAYLAFHNAIMPGDPPRVIVWSDDDWFEPAKLGEYATEGDPGITYIIPNGLKWRFKDKS